MELFLRHKVVETENGTEIIIYINPNNYEFAQELSERVDSGSPVSLEKQVNHYIRRKVGSAVQAKVVRVMFGTMLIATLAMNYQTGSASANSTGTATQQSNNISIVIDGKQVSYSQEPLIKNGVTYIPIRGVAETLGASVWWNGESQTVGINKDNTKIAFTVGSTVARVNDEITNVPPSLLVNGTVMVPIRFVSTTLGLNVDWNAESRTVSISSPVSQTTSYKVVSGDTLWSISKKHGVSVNDIKAMNKLTTDQLFVGQTLTIATQTTPTKSQNSTSSQASAENVIKYQVVSGDTLTKIANKYKTTVEQIKQDNHLTTDALYVGQFLNIKTETVASSPTQLTVPSTYKVVAGDSLSQIAKKFNLSVTNIKEWNQMTNDTIYVGQVLRLTNGGTTTSTGPVASQTQSTGSPSVTYSTHVVQSGDNMWNLSTKYGVPMTELLAVNKMSQTTPLSIGQRILIPVHNIPVMKTVSAKHGEYLDWWTEAQYVFSIGKVAKVTDFQTGKSFMVKRTIGANHADSEPLTAADAAIMKQVWGGSWSWKTRPVIVEVDGRKLAASMSAMPHDVQYITDNNFNGHFDIHFKNSTRHKDGKVDYDHQAKIKVAAGTS